MKIPSEKLLERLNEIVEKPLGTLNDPETTEMVLRRRLTKKEFKLFVAELQGEPMDEVMKKLKLDEERRRELTANIRQKLNRDSIKRELYEAES
jgi:hypothetical protein